MTRYLPTAPYKGTRDFLPADMSVRQQVFGRLYEVIEGYGYNRYDGPILEPAEIYEAKSGQEIAELQLYTLEDRGGRRLALRPEMTPSVARMIAANAPSLQMPARWYSHPNCHRYERPQRGRVREHWQINVDLFGSESLNAEVEIFELIHDMMAALGATGEMYLLRANDRVLLESLLTDLVGVPAEKMGDVASVIDHWEKRPLDDIREEAASHGVTDTQFDRLETLLKNGDHLLDELPPSVVERSKLATILKSSAADLVTFDPLIVRAFEYYTSTVFEVFDRDPANNRSLFGGGRYDDLVGLFSSQRIPGIGFGLGDVTLFDFLDTHDLLPAPKAEADVVVIPLSDDLQAAGRTTARRLRRAGWRTALPPAARKLAKELARADRSGAQAVVIIGPDEWDRDEVAVRVLATGEQVTVSAVDVAARVGELVG